MKKILPIIILIIVILIAMFSLALIQYLPDKIFALSSGQSRVITITNLEGKVQAITSGGSKTINAFQNMRLLQGDKLITGAKAWVSLKIDRDKEIFVSENSSFSIDEVSGSKNTLKTQLELETGKVWTNIKEKMNENSKFEIKTPTATMGVRGTKFYVDTSMEITQLAVLDGTVSITTKILKQAPEGKVKAEEVTLLVNKNKQIVIEKDQVTSREELESKIENVNVSSIDAYTLLFIQQDLNGIDQGIVNEINELVGYITMERTLIQEGKVQIKGKVLLPAGQIHTGGGHIHIRNSKNSWVYYGLLNAYGDFVAGNLTDGAYWLRSDPDHVNLYSRSNEVPFIIKDGKANPDQINVKLNNIQLSGTIVNPGGMPVLKGNLYISDSRGNWIYYAEIEKAINTINVGGLSDGSYTTIAYPASNSDLVSSEAKGFVIKNGIANPNKIKLMLNTPQFSGTVLLADGKTVSKGGHVHVRDAENKWVQYVNLDTSGGFRVGGLKDGRYWLLADSSEDPGYVSTDELELEIVNGKAFPKSAKLIFNK